EDLVLRESRPSAGGYVADGVVAGLAIRQSNIGKQVHQVGDALQRNEVILDVLTSGEVPAAPSEFVGDACQLPDLLRRAESAGDFTPNHLNPCLTLAIDAVLQAEGTEIVLGHFACKEREGCAAERFDFFPNGPGMVLLELLALVEVFLDGG